MFNQQMPLMSFHDAAAAAAEDTGWLAASTCAMSATTRILTQNLSMCLLLQRSQLFASCTCMKERSASQAYETLIRRHAGFLLLLITSSCTDDSCLDTV